MQSDLSTPQIYQIPCSAEGPHSSSGTEDPMLGELSTQNVITNETDRKLVGAP